MTVTTKVARPLLPRSKRELLILSVTLLLVVAALDWALTTKRPKLTLTEQQGERINQRAWNTRTMTRDEVIAFIGLPEGDYRSDRSERVQTLPRKRQYGLAYSVWISDEGYMVVTYDAKTHYVINAGYTKFKKPPSFGERFDEWFLWVVQKLGA
jgi:hypothetical protein